jgi:hypothetical protein
VYIPPKLPFGPSKVKFPKLILAISKRSRPRSASKEYDSVYMNTQKLMKFKITEIQYFL